MAAAIAQQVDLDRASDLVACEHSDENVGTLIIGPFPAPRMLRFGAGGYPGRDGNSVRVELVGTTAGGTISPNTMDLLIEAALEPVQMNGLPALLIRLDDEVDGVITMRVEDGLVTGLYYVRNPEKLSRVERETAVSR